MTFYRRIIQKGAWVAMSEATFSFAQLIWAIVLAAGIPSAIFAFVLRRFEKRIDAKERREEEKEQARQRHETLLIMISFASLALGEATAEAVQRIPDANCNGDMHEALNKAKEAKAEYRRFETEQAVRSLH